MKNNLIIFPNNKFILDNYNNIFIDDFCFDQINNNNLFSKYEVEQSILNSSEQIINSYQNINKIFYSILPQVKNELNRIHGLKYELPQWEIIIGPFLRKLIQQYYYKYNLVEHIFKKKKIDHAFLSFNKDFCLSSFHDSNDILYFSTDNNWNAILWSQIIKDVAPDINYTNFEIKNFQIQKEYDLLFKTRLSKNTFNFKEELKTFFFKFINKVHKSSDGVFYKTNFTFLDEKRIELKMKQVPKYNKFNTIKYPGYDKSLRKEINFIFNSKFKIENLILKHLPELLPIFVIEGFKKILTNVLNSSLPSNPKFIITASAFDNDENFKIYLADKKDKNKNLKYIILQHGGSYQTNIENRFLNEVNTVDNFLSWGSYKSNSKIKTIFNVKLLNKKYFEKTNNTSHLLVIFRSLGHRIQAFDRYQETKEELLSTRRILQHMPLELKKKTILRIHPNFFNTYNKDSEIYKKYISYFVENKDYKISFQKKDYIKNIHDSKLVYFNSDSTGILETLSINKPTIVHWKFMYKNLNPEVMDHYKYLVEANIMFENEDIFMRHLNKIWNNIDDWWFSELVQKNLKKFTNLHSLLPPKKYINKIAESINKNL